MEKLKVNQADLVALIGHRAGEINTWIMVRNMIWVTLLGIAIWQISEAIKANNKWHWVLVGCLCIAWVGFEASCAYYLHVNGAQNKRLEKLLEQPELGHEFGRTLENPKAKGAAPVGFFLPYLALFVLACAMLYRLPPTNSGTGWVFKLIIGLLLTGAYYGWLMWAAGKAAR